MRAAACLNNGVMHIVLAAQLLGQLLCRPWMAVGVAYRVAVSVTAESGKFGFDKM